MTARHARPVVAALLAAVLAGAALRVVALDRSSFWLDESYGVDVARQPVATLLSGHVGDAHTPPLYYVLLHLWMQWGDSDAWLRGLSALISIVVLALAAWWLARHFGAGKAVLGTIVLAVSPYQVYFAQEARMYSLATLLALAVFMLEERAARDRGPLVQLGLVAVGAAGLYTHYYLAFVLGGSALVRAVRMASGRGAGDSWRRLVLVHAGIGALFAPWLAVVGTLAASGGQQFHQSLPGVLPYAWFRFLFGFAVVPSTVTMKADPVATFLRAWPALVAVFGLGLLGAAGLWAAGRRAVGGAAAATVRHAAGVLSVVFAVPFVVSLAVPMYGERYLGIVQPLVLLVLVAGLLGLPRRAAALAVGALLAVSVVGTARWTLGLAGAKEDWRGAVAAIEARARPGDRVVLDPWFNAWPVRRYLRREDLDVRTTRAVDPVTELLDCRRDRPQPGGSWWVVVSRSPRTAAAWESRVAPCATLADSTSYPAGVGITVLRFGAAGGPGTGPR